MRLGKKSKKIEPDANTVKTSTADFVDYYNQTTPERFPRASFQLLDKFRATHSSLFNGSDDWTIEKHRKKLMDWLSSHNERF